MIFCFISRVHGVQTVEGLMDVSAKFQLYYGAEVPKMIDWEKIQNLSEDDPEREAVETRFRAATRTDKYMVINAEVFFVFMLGVSVINSS